MKLPKLYAKGNNGKVLQWEVEIEGDKFRSIGGQVGGALVTKAWTVAEPKNVGKTNETTGAQQALSEAQSKWDKKIKEGYFENIADVDNFTFVEPMLAKQFEDYKEDITYPVVVDDKFNGVRCQRWSKGAYSRKGEEFFNIQHIVKATEALLQKYPSLVLDGELFNEGLKNHLNRLTKLVSVNIKAKDVTPELIRDSEAIVRFYVYDAYGFGNITKSTPFRKRRAALAELIKGVPYLVPVKGVECKNEAEVRAELRKRRLLKEEGIIIRWGDCPYENKRSKYLLKAKNFEEDEFKVLDVEEGKADWKGAACRIICLIEKGTGAGKTFASNIDGTYEERKEVFENKKKYIGKLATVEYQELSEYGIPLIPYVRAWRDYE